ncbi:hypothetical protein J2Z19_003267 [Ensifer adhaerens]|uniref:Uncharacterized protein n=1 Tax=Ensifer adhaerens TaxID=106592 RepID=A0ACC5SXF5_ENSAD|nr:hypothetical protein [Ensifer adhaerens]MBP1873552.1 hypothetical protein [Ensifer adhaerens]
MALPAHYMTGTATVAANGIAVTGQGTTWLNSIQPGDLFGTHKGCGVRILSVNSNTSLTLAYPWLGGAQAAAAYEIQITPDSGRMDQATRDLLEMLKNGNLAALAGLNSAADKVPWFDGAGTAALTTFTATGRSLVGAANGAAAYAALGEIPNGQLPARIKEISPAIADLGAVTVNGWGYSTADPSTPVPNGFGMSMTCLSSAPYGWQVWGRPVTNELWYRGKNNNVPTNWGKFLIGDVAGKLRGALTVTENDTLPSLAGATMLTLQKVGDVLLQLVSGDANAAYLRFGNVSEAYRGQIDYAHAVNRMSFATNGIVRFQIYDDGTLRSVPTYNATSASAANVFVASNGTLVRATSSGRYKIDVEDLWPEYRDVIMELRPVWYRSLCSIDNPDWSYIGFIAEEVGVIEPRLVHWRTEEIVDEEVDREVMVPVERETVRSIETPITEFVDTGLVDDDGQPILREVQRVETTTETIVEMVEEPRTVKETVQRSVPLETPVAEGIMYERLVVHLIAKVQQQQAQIDDLLGRVTALE